MPNLRVISDNAADRAGVVATPVVASLPASNLLQDNKFAVCRSTDKTLAITASWTSAESFRAVVLPYTNLSPTATMRVRTTLDNWQSTAYDSGFVLCCPAPGTKLRGWANDAAASAYGYGGGSCATLWLSSVKLATGLKVDIVDTNNLQGYVEASRLIVGTYWEPTDGAEAGASISVVDNSKHTRTEAGGMLTEVGTRFRKQSLSMPCLNETDRQALWSILMAGGIASPIFISVYPDNANKALEKAHAMYGKLVTTPVMTQPYFNIATATLEIEEV